MKTALLLIPFFTMSLAGPVPSSPAGEAAQVHSRTVSPTDPLVSDILAFTNKARAKKGLKPLVMKEELNSIARGHSENMASGKVPFSHDGFKDRYASARKLFTNVYSFAENVSFGPHTGKEAVDGWMNSKQHKENIMGDFTSIGIGVGTDKNGRNYFTQVFCKE